MFKSFALFARDKEGAAIVEAAMLLPVMLTMLFGLWDLGNGILYSQHTITASQVVGDLITREKSVTTAMLDNYIEAGRLAYGNQDTTSYGVDIVSVEFDSFGVPQVPNPDAVTSTAGLGEADEGVVVVTVTYTYTPLFASLFTNDIIMTETSYLRGRRSDTVKRT